VVLLGVSSPVDLSRQYPRYCQSDYRRFRRHQLHRLGRKHRYQRLLSFFPSLISANFNLSTNRNDRRCGRATVKWWRFCHLPKIRAIWVVQTVIERTSPVECRHLLHFVSIPLVAIPTIISLFRLPVTSPAILLATARAITVGSSTTSYTDLGREHRYQRVTLVFPSLILLNFNLGLTGMTADADVQLFNAWRFCHCQFDSGWYGF
jgi:hypothetical protein